MKKLLYTLALSITIWSCGGGGSDTPTPPPPTNDAPTTPVLVYPSNNLLCIDNVLNFDWNASTDPDGDAITYTVQVSTNAQFTQIVHNLNNLTSTSRSLTLDRGVAYYWRAKATDNNSAASSYSSTNQFYTEGDGVSNHLPFTPVLISPELNSPVAGTAANLQWTADDVDTEDTLTFDVYLDTVTPPVASAAADQAAESLNATNLAASTTYYWKVVVKDGEGGQTIGQIWNFTTD